MSLFDIDVTPDFDGLLRCLRREGTPRRVHNIELFADVEIRDVVARRFDLEKGLDPGDPWFALKREIAIQRFLGYEIFPVEMSFIGFELAGHSATATDPNQIEGQERAERNWIDEHTGPIQTWEDFEKILADIDSATFDTSTYEWLEKNLPGDMRVCTLSGHIIESLLGLVGYESLCLKVYREPDLVEAILDKIGRFWVRHVETLCQFNCTGLIWGSDDMGFKTQTFLPPDLMRRLILPWHKRCAEAAHTADKPYLLHACGCLDAIMDDLIDDVKIDAKHSWEDVIVPVTEAKRRWGDRIAVLGGIDVDFLCRQDEAAIRKRVRETLEICQPGGGYCLGTGNTVANYIPVDNYLAMLDEGRRFGR